MQFDRMLKLDLASKKSFFLFGPRGTGKTSWVNHYLRDNAFYIDLLNSDYAITLQARPHTLAELVEGCGKEWVVIDEVQKIPELLDEVHRLIETKGYRFILTGSSSRKLKRQGVNLLAGRALNYYMHPLTVCEVHDRFVLEKALKEGMLPSVFFEKDTRHYLATYIQNYVREEVIQEGLVRNVGAFNRFLEVASFSQGSQINMSAIARESGVNQKLISSYFEILEDLLIAVRVPVFTKRAQRKLTQHPKFYYFDAGVYHFLRPKGPLDRPEEIGGAAFETLLLQHLRAYIDYYQWDLKVFFWRTVAGLEVDFVVYGENGLFAFECKSRAYLEPKDYRGLKAFQKDYPIARCYLVYAGCDKRKHDGIEAVPMTMLLRELPSILAGG